MALALTDFQTVDVGGLTRYRVPGGSALYAKGDALDLLYVLNYRGATSLVELSFPSLLAKTLRDSYAVGLVIKFDSPDPLAGILTPAAISANTNNWAPALFTSTTTILRIAATAARSITGLTGGWGSRVLEVWNVGTFAITLTANSSSSLAVNRFLFPANIVLAANGGGVILRYDPVGLGWRAAGKA